MRVRRSLSKAAKRQLLVRVSPSIEDRVCALVHNHGEWVVEAEAGFLQLYHPLRIPIRVRATKWLLPWTL